MKLPIGCRWHPGHSIRRDAATGAYEEINPPLVGAAETLVQRAYLARVKPSVLARERVCFSRTRSTA